MKMVGSTLSRSTVAGLFEPAAAPLLPALSVAVQLTLLTPSAETVRGALAFGLPRPVIDPTVAPVHVMPVMLLHPVVVTSAVTLPVTGDVRKQPFWPSGGGKVTVTTGDVVSNSTFATKASPGRMPPPAPPLKLVAKGPPP